MLVKKMLKILLLGLIVSGVSLSAGIVNNDDTTIKLVGVDRLPTNDMSGYAFSINGAFYCEFPGGMKYYHAQGGFTDVVNGTVTIERIYARHCGNVKISLIRNRYFSRPKKVIFSIRKNVPCGRTTVIRVR